MNWLIMIMYGIFTVGHVPSALSISDVASVSDELRRDGSGDVSDEFD